ncbi:hypothetical protein TNCV_3086621 [Trichonephila clavipes]|nr:hypothetical protein TNCV_3086621 [Trichonephila clavipes]
MGSNKGGCVPVIWQKPSAALTWSTPRIKCYSIMARIHRVNPPPLICSTNPTTMSLRGHRREALPADGQKRAHSCLPSTAKRGPKGQLKCIPWTPYSFLRDTTTRQAYGSEHQRC